MNKMLAIALKELKAYFQSPMAYIVLVITLSVFNIFFFMIIDQNAEATLRDIFKVMEFMFIFIIPLFTMKTIAEERSSGTMEFLLTTPTTVNAIVIGKYLGTLMFFTLMMVLTLSYYFIIEAFAQPDRLAILCGYKGVWLEGAFFIAVGLMASSWTKNQIVAAISAYVILFMLYFTIAFVKYFSGSAESLIRYIGTWSHSGNLVSGLVTTSDVIYYISGIVFCLMMTRISIESR